MDVHLAESPGPDCVAELHKFGAVPKLTACVPLNEDFGHLVASRLSRCPARSLLSIERGRAVVVVVANANVDGSQHDSLLARGVFKGRNRTLRLAEGSGKVK